MSQDILFFICAWAFAGVGFKGFGEVGHIVKAAKQGRLRYGFARRKKFLGLFTAVVV